MKNLRILIPCESLDGRGGTELYVRDVAHALLRFGHTPIVYSTRPGKIATEIRNMTIPVVDSLDALAVTPDLIYGQHHLPTMTALLHFAGVPAIYVCHDWYGQNAFAPRFPRILRFVAVDVTCRDRLIYEDGINESRVCLLPSFVDLNRFGQRPPLPAQPRRALVFGNYTKENPHLSALRICRANSCAMN
ncbi:MAG: glycosyltransferase [Pyrinomonadaceae bacterium]